MVAYWIEKCKRCNNYKQGCLIARMTTDAEPNDNTIHHSSCRCVASSLEKNSQLTVVKSSLKNRCCTLGILNPSKTAERKLFWNAIKSRACSYCGKSSAALCNWQCCASFTKCTGLKTLDWSKFLGLMQRDRIKNILVEGTKLK